MARKKVSKKGVNKNLIIGVVVVVLLLVGVFWYFNQSDEVGLSPGSGIIQMELNKGWNLVNLALVWELFDTENEEKLYDMEIWAAFGYDKKNEDYNRFHPFRQNDKIDAWYKNVMKDPKSRATAAYSSMWIYSNKKQTLNLGRITELREWLEKLVMSNVIFPKGWNFGSITEQMIGEAWDGVKGSCNPRKPGFVSWDSENQEWKERSKDYLKNTAFENSELYSGFVFNADENCKLRKRPSIPDAPTLPSAAPTGYVVWQDDRDGNEDIYMYDLSTEKETQITTDSKIQSEPSISSDKIVWTDYRNGNGDIYLCDLSLNGKDGGCLGNDKKTQITTDSNDQHDPSISGDKIVWEDNRNANWDVYMYDLSTEKETRITTDSKRQYNPVISGDKIVWRDRRNDYGDIYMYDLSTEKETQITTDSKTTQSSPSISGDKIVWADYRNGNGDIYLCDLSLNGKEGGCFGNDKKTQITTDPKNQQYPSISGDKIVWTDIRNGNLDVYMYDLSTEKETQITDSRSQGSPSISGDKIVLGDYRNGKGDIYMYDLSTGKETQITTDSKHQRQPSIWTA